MSDFISIFDVVENNGSLTPIKDEILTMKQKIKQEMDKGLSPDDMQLARKQEETVLVAEAILETL